ncbi:MAG: c-type cytochrome [SAR324 cluster bacterium]|nr:c-type cytochrome [SAR324 cluster bacterium]MBL7034818.1 c-type cytochrome [SAR324 cluster bacterium]
MNNHFITGIITLVLGTVFSINAFAEGDLERGEANYKVCTACHGDDGEGKLITNAPRLAGQQAWYLARQLNNFKKGIRGTHHQDIIGMQMRPMAISLVTDQDVEDVVAYIGTLNGRAKHSGIEGDVSAGKAAYAVCTSCHGANGEGIQALNAPKIAGLPDWYVQRQLHNFKNGLRGVKTQDVYGQQMRPMAMTLADETAVSNITAYVATLKGVSSALPVTVKANTAVSIVQTPVSEPLYAPCASCHGSMGEGSQKLGAPRLAGQHDWYLKRQLSNWREGIRGAHAEDLYGMQMRPMAMTLTNDYELDKVVEFIGTLKGAPAKATLKGDLAAGKTSYATCIACHGLQGEGNKLLNAPKIAGLPDWYIARQLMSFKKGIRGTHEDDLYGMQMRPMAMTLVDDNAVNNVAAYVAAFAEGESPAAVAKKTTEEPQESTPKPAAVDVALTGSVEKGKVSFAICVSCHGADGSGNKALNAPSIAGQQDWYIARQLNSFKSGLRGSHAEDIFGQQMRPMAMILADEQAIADVAAFISTLKATDPATTIQADTSAGKAAYAVCLSCHGANGEGNKTLNAPKIAGQQDWYLVRQLQNFKKGIRGAEANDSFGQQMRPMAMTLADDAAIKNVSAYISTLK